ncbi:MULTISPECIES: thioesterase family protein [unclassified Neptuniibacter]|uniref:acyl-CoA thioesterase n=1 Tax=unclassified Neptuniibacter TaxID=2630693 RepID=UPI000C56A271|nr:MULTISPECIES: thioesterase family protein [unclassified Neptuniibacter]MAY43010.1 thioesterase [Oceanospirillaceae bacterium]|tara:strand:+ start:21798 stop:22229 length:432 start_codon:yes stop_codon:yes gene_type:complete
MARIKIDMPDNYIFSTELPVRISDINYGGHLSNDAILAIIHEARVRFLSHYHYGELDIEGLGLILTDSAIVYKAEGFHGDQLQIDIALNDLTMYGCDIYYLISNKKTAVEIAHAKTGVVFFDYKERQIRAVPEPFKNKVFKDV